MAASAHDVAAAIRRRLLGAGPKKVHKLMYFAQGHHLAWFGRPLFDESIQAWEHGPVVADIWRAEHYEEPPETLNDLDNGQLNTVGYVLNRYGHSKPHELEMLTHNEGPWNEAYYRETGGRDRHTIFTDAIRAFFLEVHARDEAEEEIHIDPGALAAFLADSIDPANLSRRPDTRESILARLRG